MNCVFLDIDGVLNAYPFLYLWNNRLQELTQNFPSVDEDFIYHASMFDPRAVKLLNQITVATGAKIVITSQWRRSMSLEHIAKIFKAVGIIGEVVGATPKFFSNNRGDEIMAYINENGVTDFVIIDDEDRDLKDFGYKVIKTHFWDCGLMESHVDQAIKLLKGY